MSTPRLRFAPSPTGFLHIGGVRTALYCWLWARKTGGKLILRVEDTDQARNTPEAVQAIYDSLRWVGLEWDEGPLVGGDYGPYFQSKRLEVYAEYAERLIQEGKAYRCYCTKEDLAAAREAHQASGSKDRFKYPGTCRDRTDQPDGPWVIRFRAPTEGTTAWDDLIKGRIEVPNFTMQDFVILRQNGLPLYNFACVVDDASMKVTVAIRGDDHVINTAPQILLYEALGETVPQFGHLPLILSQKGQKLSKRHAAVSTLEYRDMGYLPDAVLNYLARLGWSHGDQEIFTREELVEKFDWSACGVSGAKYDEKKFAFVQAEHLRRLPDTELAAWVAPMLPEEFAVTAENPTLLGALPLIKPRATTLHDIVDGVDYFFRQDLEFEEKGRRKFLKPENATRLRDFATLIEEQEDFSKEALHEATTTWLESREMKLKDIAQAARVALTGRTRSPGIFEVMVLLGRETSLGRLRHGAEISETPMEPQA